MFLTYIKVEYLRYDPGDRKKHAARVGLLNRLSVLVESESQLLNVAQCVEWDEFTDRRRMVEGFAKLPRQPFVAQFPLPVACSKVDTYRHLVVVARSKPFVDIFTQPADFYDDFRLVMDFVREVRDEERLSAPSRLS